MRAMVIEAQGPIESQPLHLLELDKPRPAANEILVRVLACGVCRTDLHVSEGDLPPHRERIVPGHEVVGEVAQCGAQARRFQLGQRVGVAWLRETCGVCKYCRRGDENLCPNARFTGYDHDGGYAEYTVVREDYAYAMPENLTVQDSAPLLCAGIIGYRALKRAGVRPHSTVGLYGFGGSAHIALQVARYWGCQVYVMTRGGRHRAHAHEMGADWVGTAAERPPAPLDCAILFAPAGDLVAPAMEALDRGGILAVAGIYLSPIPSLDYQRDLFYEKELRSVTANTRRDGEEFLELAGKIPIRTTTEPSSLEQANQALAALKHDQLKGAAVLRIAI
jgi:propanol-preferring alcohol dehydrogenase